MTPLVQNKDEQKRIIGEYLKAADKFIKSAEFPQALDQVNKALALEPNNMYALAYSERIKVASEAAQKKEAEARMKRTPEEQKPVQEKTPAPAPPRVPDAKPQPQGGFQPAASASPVSPQRPADASVAADHLKILFEKAWEDGAISSDERALLETLKSSLGVSDSAFTAMENETKGSAYLAALRKVWHDGVVTPEESDELTHLRQKLNISAEDHFKFEAEVRKETQAKK
ncbi:MAG: hypothetical protein KGJ59_00015 [Bacteroidota bacterium]|nr:hypothetical protein [Bacteroidota bacterium]